MDAIENLSDEEVIMFLDEKWVKPITDGICSMFTYITHSLTTSTTDLSQKYASSYVQINNKLKSAQKDLSDSIDLLTGDTYTIAALKELSNN